MRLKRLDAVGFKSFADKTAFQFEPGITAIIGPNGSGKSNVVDAIKWVLGETRPKSLRGGEMQDVVFKGAEGRAGAGFAEVMLVLDNEEGRLPGRGAEVSIGRRLFKTGESEYLVDRQVVRRKDVRELLLDTGLGVGAYSVMEQGKIDAVLSANPEDRRQIFEEASGISKFKLRRREALRKLDRTEQNLLRVGDLLEEKQRRLRSLKIQAGRARRYQELSGQLTSLRVAQGLTEVGDAGMRRQEAKQEQEESTRRLAEMEAALGEAERAQRELREEEEHLEEELEVLGSSLSETRSSEEGTRERMRGLEGQIASLEKRVREATGQRQRILESRSQQEQEFFSAQESAAARTGELERLREEYDGIREIHADRAARLRQAQEDRNRAEEESLEWLRQSAQAGNRVSDAEARLRALEEGLERLGSRAAGLDEHLAGLAREIGELQERERTHEQAAGEAEREMEAAGRQGAAAEAVLADLKGEQQGLRERISGLVSRTEVLRDLELSLAGMDEGPRRVLEQDFEGLRGRLVDGFDCAADDALALEAALGERVDALVVEGAESAEEVIRWLTEDHLGYVHLALAGGEQAPFVGVRSHPEIEGVQGWLLDRVTVRPGFETTAQALLAGVLLVDSVAAGREASHLLGRGYLCVTPAGERIENGCLISGGWTDVGAGPIQRRTELRELEEALRSEQAALAENERRSAEQAEVAATAREQEARARNTLQAARQAARGVAETLLRAEERAAGSSRERESLRLECGETESSLAGIREQLAVLRREHESAKEEGAQADERLSEVRRRVEELTGHRDESLARENQLRVEIATAESDLEGLEARIAVLGRNVQENGVRVEELRDEAQEAEETIETARATLATLEGEAGGFLEERARLDVRIRALQDLRRERRERLAALEEQLEAGREERTELRSRLERLGFREREIATGLAATREKLLEEHGVDLDYFLQAAHPFGPPLPPGMDGTGTLIFGPLPAPGWAYPEESVERIWADPGFETAGVKGEIANVRRAMDRIGTVNLRAVEELAQEEGAVELLAREEGDLREGRRALGEMIDHINSESARLFNETFSRARENFIEIFRKLFQGGKADILLSVSDDPLEAGIEIVARPPGKQLQNINLLSGGERTLCALAILFSVFKVKPSPFAVLDEVDAALDDSNVDRFLDVLKDFVAETQFLVVTHNKRTMAFAEVLYGITMQRKGISSCVSVRLDEVEQMAG